MEVLKGFFRGRRSLIRGLFNVFCTILLFLFLVLDGKSLKGGIVHRGVAEERNASIRNYLIAGRSPTFCAGLHDHKGFKSQCDYLIAHPECADAGGFFNYVFFFYCDCEKHTSLGYVALLLWLASLFYLLGNTASDYFCFFLEQLSGLLNLPPTVAGVTLLPLGNGAPDVFASIAAFIGAGDGRVGLNGVLGGAVFVVCIVAGTISLLVHDQSVPINRKCFLRDVCFLLFTLASVVMILMVGVVSIWGAIAYLSIYLVYALFVAASEICRKNTNLLTESVSIYASLLESGSNNGLPLNLMEEEMPKPVWGWSEQVQEKEPSTFTTSDLCALLEMPLTIPRRLTIPMAEEARWSKGYAMASAFLAPILLAFLWTSQDNISPTSVIFAYLVASIVGALLCFLAAIYTKADRPPRKCLFPWAFGGFFMSIVWFYMAANELVALLVALGVIFDISPSILGLTVLAWGNSVGDLMSNVALAMNGADGLQIAMSGCYAGPMFNALVGLGISLLLGAWARWPASYVVPTDKSLYFSVGFLVLGLLWSLVVLPCKNMRPGKVLGVGLIVIYFAFLSFRVSTAMGALSWMV